MPFAFETLLYPFLFICSSNRLLPYFFFTASLLLHCQLYLLSFPSFLVLLLGCYAMSLFILSSNRFCPILFWAVLIFFLFFGRNYSLLFGVESMHLEMSTLILSVSVLMGWQALLWDEFQAWKGMIFHVEVETIYFGSFFSRKERNKIAFEVEVMDLHLSLYLTISGF